MILVWTRLMFFSPFSSQISPSTLLCHFSMQIWCQLPRTGASDPMAPKRRRSHFPWEPNNGQYEILGLSQLRGTDGCQGLGIRSTQCCITWCFMKIKDIVVQVLTATRSPCQLHSTHSLVNILGERGNSQSSGLLMVYKVFHLTCCRWRQTEGHLYFRLLNDWGRTGELTMQIFRKGWPFQIKCCEMNDNSKNVWSILSGVESCLLPS